MRQLHFFFYQWIRGAALIGAIAGVCSPLTAEEKQPACSGAWALQDFSIEEELPDLRNQFVFLGCNKRPDARSGKFFLELATTNAIQEVSLGEKVFLRQGPDEETLVFSAEPTPLWLECRPSSDGRSLDVVVRMKGALGGAVSSPKERAHFSLSMAPRCSQTWEIGGMRVEPSIAVKQRIRCVGGDKFLLMHGGADYVIQAAKERVDFESLSGEAYSQYLAVGDVLLWDQDRWVPYKTFQGDGTRVPLLEVKRLDDRMMVIELWSIDGLMSQQITLVKQVSSPIEIAELVKEFSFVGMRTWSRPIITAGKDRLVLSADDWVIHTGERWERVTSKRQLEDYLSGKLRSPLLVFERIDKEDGEFVFKGHVFNTQRTVVETISLPLKQVLETVAQSHLGQESGTKNSRIGGGS
ncbi:hypothetical protein FTN76_04425 [Chlamydia trachomatis]|uniref:Exported protein n=2 Tax=Chlamydia trachomatis TaxID=813 RepID=A0A0H3MHK3_CHLT2|nr:hypothetical protein [Chlamydia trachomatis]AGJ64950.1 hypothetical protein CTLINITIAL_04355 [Chlamydia trachomatis L2/434/Bu(i)]AGJ65891.1 hypothetical protein CTLFINAL_04360 [Chlamydia trachomatis L2/434/Bu(f)]AGR94930.1 hypothetical protein CTRC46_03020 [Chlamydia trachomatis RC-L2(s)/46]AGR96809.1 hypothetical protein CTRC943_03005 [Chlamydia trachomatis RC-J/943]AGR98650.1 hypothetical protein CTRC3_03045 [Chlamydia trachomatis RC-L2(s)/3]